MNKAVGVRVAVIGCGLMARNYVRQMLSGTSPTTVLAVSDPSPQAYRAIAQLFQEAALEPPPNLPFESLLAIYADRLDVALITTPHRYHYQQAKACLEANLDVLLEKPMVIEPYEARELIRIRDRTQRHLVVAFNASLSSYIQTARQLLRSGELGRLLNINAVVWEGWLNSYRGNWKQDPAISGGGFWFDTGSHMMNLVLELADEAVEEVSAYLTFSEDTPGLDITGTVTGRLASGALFTMTACGNTIRTCDSDVRVFCTSGILRTGVWGERLELQREGESEPQIVTIPAPISRWERFLAVRNGLEANPCPPEAGLRMALLWEAIKASANKHGLPTKVTSLFEGGSGVLEGR